MALFKTLRNTALLLAAIEVANLAAYRIFRGPSPQEVQIIAHRGGATLAPENTEEAFRNAARVGADWMECDVHRTTDGVLVIMHDDTVNRMTDGEGFIKDMTWEQISALHLVNGERVMTFEEFVALAKEEGMGILVELKSTAYYPGIEENALAIVKRAGYLEKTTFISFDWDVLEQLKELEPGVRVGPLYGRYQMDVSNPRPPEAEIIAPMAEMVAINPWIITRAHAAGRQVWVWFGMWDKPIMYRLMLGLGVDGIIVNDPVAAIQLILSAAPSASSPVQEPQP